jgi:hypothetical protein
MSQQPSSPAGPSGDDWPDYLWPGEEDGAPGGATPAPLPGGPPPRGFRPGVLGVVIMVAVLAGGGIALAVQLLSGPSDGAAANGQPPVLSPARPGSQPGGNGQPGSQVGGNGQPGSQVGGNGVPGGAGAGTGGQFMMIGQVTAVSGNSITIGGPGHTVTASVTGATRITGKVTSISGIRVGDQVSAQITDQGARFTVVAIQYPAQLPAGAPGG